MKANLNLFITRTIQAKSFLKAFLQFQEFHMAHAYGANCDAITIKDTGGTDRALQQAAYDLKNFGALEALATDDAGGILVGIGTTAPDVSDNAMETLTAHGLGATQLEYGACGVGAATVVGSKMVMNIVRAFINSSGH